MDKLSELLRQIDLDRKDFDRFWRAAISGEKLEVLVHVRNADDVQALIQENNELRDQIKKLQRDIFSWTSMGVKYMEALDDLRELQRICQRLGIDFDFRSLR